MARTVHFQQQNCSIVYQHHLPEKLSCVQLLDNFNNIYVDIQQYLEFIPFLQNLAAH
ncbi:hypothetical protein NIES4101_45370 [Calothrix sp. NIES-4101]|nr:hypothetical protein NIES4101_45370 [Calothrix sp. NIES-4101]